MSKSVLKAGSAFKIGHLFGTKKKKRKSNNYRGSDQKKIHSHFSFAHSNSVYLAVFVLWTKKYVNPLKALPAFSMG